MADIKPVLDAYQWEDWVAEGWPTERRALREDGGMSDDDVARVCAKEVARYNAALPDGDPRKLTWDDVRCIRDLAELAWLREMSIKIAEPFARKNADRAKAEMLQLADKIAALLPPRE